MSEKPAIPPLTIPRQAVVEGGIKYPGNVVVEGMILGDIFCANILVAERGAVDGIISANAATIMGEASGSIYANQVTLKTACSVTAEIFYKKLALENGCFFEGKSRRVANPLSLTRWDAHEDHASDGLVR